MRPALEDRVLRPLANGPTDPALRRRRFSNGLWAVTISVGNDEISVLWDGEDLPETVVVRYIGTLPHASDFRRRNLTRYRHDSASMPPERAEP